MEEQSQEIQKKITKNKIDKRDFWVSILNPLSLFIGRWKFEPINEKDELVLRIYFIRKTICYEVLFWNGYRKKIEFQWSNIIGIRASFNHNEPGTLEFELSEPPKYYEELNNVDQRAHHKWIDGIDFTQGQAPICRRHLILFPSGMLDKHFERLISFDEHLFELIQKPFPTISVSYFQKQQPLLQSAIIQNHFPISTSNNQILQLSHHAPHLISIPQTTSGVANLPSNSMSTVTMNNNSNSNVPQECSNWRSVPQVSNSSNGYLWNNNSINIGSGSIISNNINGGSNIMYNNDDNGIWNNEGMMNNPNNGNGSSSNYSVEASNGYFSNWPTDDHGVWLPPPPHQQIRKQHIDPQI